MAKYRITDHAWRRYRRRVRPLGLPRLKALAESLVPLPWRAVDSLGCHSDRRNLKRLKHRCRYRATATAILAVTRRKVVVTVLPMTDDFLASLLVHLLLGQWLEPQQLPRSP